MGNMEPGPAARERALLLGELVQIRADVLALTAGGHYEEAIKTGDQVMARVSEFLGRQETAETALDELGFLPHLAQNIGFLADMSLAAIGSGDENHAAEFLKALGDASARIKVVADRLVGFGMQYCKDGRPSLDGSCLKSPPCEP